MPRAAKAKSSSKDSTTNLGFEAKPWLTADKLRNTMDTADWNRAINQCGVQLVNFLEFNDGIAMRECAKPICQGSLRKFHQAKHHRIDISICGQKRKATACRFKFSPILR